MVRLECVGVRFDDIEAGLPEQIGDGVVGEPVVMIGMDVFDTSEEPEKRIDTEGVWHRYDELSSPASHQIANRRKHQPRVEEMFDDFAGDDNVEAPVS